MFNRNERERERTVRDPQGTAVAERGDEHEHDPVPVHDERRHEHGHALGVDRERQHDEFGGFNLGAAFFGWLVAIGLAALLTALLSAAGAAIGLTEVSADEASSSAETLTIVGAALLLLVLALSYYAGGYVAGRMSRFDGGRQGLGVWGIGLLVTILLGVIGAVAGTEYNVLGSLDLPRLPIDEGSLATGALITLAAVVVLTALAAMAGGKAGERYHRKVDAVGLHRDRV